MPTLYVMKVNCNGVLRRISSRCYPPTFRHVSLRIRASLDIPASKPFSLTYTDTDGDVIALSTDDDFYDAFIFQELNPTLVFYPPFW
ncbi:unnamed protein product [Closterium sp. NIES-64]|nr:unnamed protein product [Closterium sp. NIES-64]